MENADDINPVRNGLMKGYALVLSLIFLLILSLFGFSLLLIAGAHYASVRDLFGNENARIACESAARFVVDRHNLDKEVPPFLFNPQNWIGKSLQDFDWNGYRISASLSQPWSRTGPNLLLFSAGKGRYLARRQWEIRQRRLEDFAFLCDGAQVLPLPSLFDGLVLTRQGLELSQPGVRFREIVQGGVFPEVYASFAKRTLQSLDYSTMDQLIPVSALREGARLNGVLISGKDAVFWKSDHYELDLDRLQIEQVNARWSIRYQGRAIASSFVPFLWFDETVHILQSDSPVSFPPTGKTRVPVYVGSEADVVICSNLHPLEGKDLVHPLSFISGGVIYVSSEVPRACYLEAFLIGLGGGERSLVIQAGGPALSSADKDQFRVRVRTSIFVIEEERRNSLLTALAADEKIVWFRGSVILRSSLQASPDLRELHFQKSTDTYPLIPSFPFVYLVEGGMQWR